MDLAPLVRAVEVLMTPLERGSREAWLVESARRVREARGDAAAGELHGSLSDDSTGELEALLQLPGDTPGWLHAALSGDPDRAAASLPEGTEGSEALLRVVTLRCALAAGLASLQPVRVARPVFGDALDDPATLPTTQELRVSFGL